MKKSNQGVLFDQDRFNKRINLFVLVLFFISAVFMSSSLYLYLIGDGVSKIFLIAAVIECVISLILLCCIFYFSKKKKRRFLSQIEDMIFCVEETTKAAVLNFPSPMVVATVSGAIQWHNPQFENLLNRGEVVGEYIQDLFPNIQFTRLIEDEDPTPEEIIYKDHIYRVTGRAIRVNQRGIINTLVGLYFTDLTNIKNLQKLLDEKKIVVCNLAIDNYDEVIKSTPNNIHGTLIGEIEGCISRWVEKGNGIINRFERDKFTILFEAVDFESLLKEKFTILSDIKKISLGNKITVTISIGIGRAGRSLQENESFARSSLDMALGRGGDQVVIKSVKGFQFYGAKSREVEKSTKVKARVIAHGLQDLAKDVSNVIIMGHRNGDADSLGASAGLFRIFTFLGCDTYIALERQHNNAIVVLNRLLECDEYKSKIINEDKAISIIDKNTLLIIVDTHSVGMVEYKELVKKAKKIVLIDHHRRCEDFIDDTILCYHEPYASSTGEMVTEILQYFDRDIPINKYEAEALYSGIYLDTKGFTFKTGARTFEAASYLRRIGVDPIDVRRLFRNDLSSYIKKAEIISNAKLYRENIAIASCNDMGVETQIIVAQAADELLNIKGVEAAFVLSVVGNRTIISGRSLDKINVQIILEKLGGGGHITIAGAQVKSNSISSAETSLKAAIDEVLFDEE